MPTFSRLARRALTGALALTASVGAVAGAAGPTDHQAIRDTVRAINDKAVIRSIDDMPIPGLKRVIADGSVLYTTEDGRYLFYGVLLDTKTHSNLTDEALGDVRVELLKTIPAADKIVFSPKNPKYTVTVFTDTGCPYCHMIQKNLQGYMDAGIAIEYVPFPRGGVQSPEMATMKSVWCAEDRKAAYATVVAGGKVQPADCARSADIAKMYALGDKLGIEGTPAIYDQTGRQLGGFLPPAALLGKLQQGQKKAQVAAVAP
ncbi:DsbC family protein [Rhodanobacter thiooxydans]|uniref:DsbC family protein n=1 Tax=Rhodanobacter thiooxydans TaxID=416169 RepID=UPI000A4DA946|nr:DsbC family protein [Rhodanobacter thiooxydans]UJJ56732.1 DsbC family protein [Rhodanobacter thiooxydans]